MQSTVLEYQYILIPWWRTCRVWFGAYFAGVYYYITSKLKNPAFYWYFKESLTVNIAIGPLLNLIGSLGCIFTLFDVFINCMVIFLIQKKIVWFGDKSYGLRRLIFCFWAEPGWTGLLIWSDNSGRCPQSPTSYMAVIVPNGT